VHADLIRRMRVLLKDAAKEKDVSLDEAYRKAMNEKRGHMRRVIGLNMKNQRQNVGMGPPGREGGSGCVSEVT
jgi:hypothetical protein